MHSVTVAVSVGEDFHYNGYTELKKTQKLKRSTSSKHVCTNAPFFLHANWESTHLIRASASGCQIAMVSCLAWPYPNLDLSRTDYGRLKRLRLVIEPKWTSRDTKLNWKTKTMVKMLRRGIWNSGACIPTDAVDSKELGSVRFRSAWEIAFFFWLMKFFCQYLSKKCILFLSKCSAMIWFVSGHLNPLPVWTDMCSVQQPPRTEKKWSSTRS